MALLGCSVSHHYWFHAFGIEFLNETSTTPCPNGAKKDLCRPFLDLYSKSILWSCNALEATFFRYSHQCRLHSNPHCLPEGADDRVLLPLKRQCAQVCDLHRSWSPSPGRRRPRRGHTLHSVHWGHLFTEGILYLECILNDLFIFSHWFGYHFLKTASCQQLSHRIHTWG